MDMLTVQGGTPLAGVITVDGSKNAALPILAATLVADGRVTLHNVPDLVDIRTMRQLLQSLGTEVHDEGRQLVVDSRPSSGVVAEYDLVRKMRASVCVLGPLLARFGTARVSLPGGCNIGHRPVDLHLRGLAALGAELRIEGGYIVAESGQLLGTDIDMSGPHGSTVTGTCNVMTAAVLAKGNTVIRSAAREPEVVCLGNFLTALGARIQGLGTSVLEIHGVDQLQGGMWTIVSDRIEASTLAIAAAVARGRITIESAPVDHMTAVLGKLRDIGVDIACREQELHVDASNELAPTDLVALPYPGVPTDTQAQFMALLATVPGKSVITDRVFPDRFMHASELARMGAIVYREADRVIVKGVAELSAAPLMACDLRASAALLLAAIRAKGESQIRRIYHLDRGYVRLEEKLNRLGARVRRISEAERATIDAATRPS